MNVPWKASWFPPILRQAPEGATSSLVRLQLPLKLHSSLAQTCHADGVRNFGMGKLSHRKFDALKSTGNQCFSDHRAFLGTGVHRKFWLNKLIILRIAMNWGGVTPFCVRNLGLRKGAKGSVVGQVFWEAPAKTHHRRFWFMPFLGKP